ncbi:PREDICTED: uncharacterized protein LOC104585909 [Nelumbo nucifera]|uniref:Uncharacterized protein LOC104585909 n=1 Tax=Nelumbo nucifera TaxID=4432 RepID=A0A1U7Z3H0_NELNU|nr:PREDICTED: uncharacterized protein LOC104585909 [Nelumbo nucifera]
MEAENSSSSCSFSTNWIVEQGCLENSITFESSVSPIDEDVDASSRDHLLLKPDSPDSGPCEIKIIFRQKHEVRQVYVRSTARVYEIYYATNQQSSNEYLCTVRCGIVAKSEIVHHTNDSGETIVANPMKEEKVKNGSHNSTNEDDWVEVKVPDSPSLDSNATFLPKKNELNMDRSIQDLYEATAEITDASPCTSLTLRLLSLQTKGCLHLQEIYIFADPVESSDSDHEVGLMEKPAGSSLMAMLVPTLLQLSKSGIGQTRERNVSNIRETYNHWGGNSETAELTNPSTWRIIKEAESSMADKQKPEIQCATGATVESTLSGSSIADQQEIKMQEVAVAMAKYCEPQPSIAEQHEVRRVAGETTQLKSETQMKGTEHRSDSVIEENGLPCSRLEKILDQLVCRMDRIEAVCSRFEENMLKPISSMETRLLRLEQQLEALTMRSHPSGRYSCTRIAAPEFSCNESESSSCVDGNDRCCYGGLESAEKDTDFDKLSPATDNAIVDASQSLPGLVVTAPEFSNGDDDDDNHNDIKSCSDSSESLKEPITVKSCPSIDDALALALAGFLTSTSIQSPQISQSLKISAPDFPNEEDHDNDNLASPIISCERLADLVTHVEQSGTERVNNSFLDPCDTASLESEVKVMQSPDNTPTEATNEAACRQEDRTEVSCNVTRTDDLMGGKETSIEEMIERTCNGVPPNEEKAEDRVPWNETIIQNQSPVSRAGERHDSTVDGTFTEGDLSLELDDDRNPGTTTKGVTAPKFTTAMEVQGAGYKDVLLHVPDQPMVDFKLPLLDVKFVVQEHWKATSPLEALLNDMTETRKEVSCASNGDDGVTTDEKHHIFSLEDDEPNAPTASDQPLLDVDDLTQKNETSNLESEPPQDLSPCSNQEPFPSLI